MDTHPTHLHKHDTATPAPSYPYSLCVGLYWDYICSQWAGWTGVGGFSTSDRKGEARKDIGKNSTIQSRKSKVILIIELFIFLREKLCWLVIIPQKSGELPPHVIFKENSLQHSWLLFWDFHDKMLNNNHSKEEKNSIWHFVSLIVLFFTNY